MGTLGDADVRTIERQAYDSWPAVETEPLGDWQLRFNHGVTNRANSVWACGSPALPLEAALERAEAWYAQRERHAIVQLSPLSGPELDPLLEARGYEAYAPVTVQVASAIDAAQGVPREGISVYCHEHLAEEWFEISGYQGRYSHEQVPLYRKMLERVSPRACFAIARRGGDAAAVGLGIHGRGWVGIFSMLTLPEHRGYGIGREVLREIAHWGAIRGGNRMYLQVEEDNPAAQALYKNAGFSTLYRYHYRRQPTR